jgi:hypothetical protein
VEDEHLAAQPAVTIYRPVRQFGFGGRLFVRTALDPQTLVPTITRTIREIAADQPVERPATLEEVRAEQLTPERVNALVFSGFAGIALLIAVVGIAGVLAFSVSARTREFGLRLAVGCSPRALLTHVLSEGTAIAIIGIGRGGRLRARARGDERLRRGAAAGRARRGCGRRRPPGVRPRRVLAAGRTRVANRRHGGVAIGLVMCMYRRGPYGRNHGERRDR